MVYPGINASLEDLIRFYHTQGYTARETIGFLAFVHHTVVSRRTIIRVLKRLSLRRHGVSSPLRTVVEKILNLRRDGFTDLGYKSMWRHLNTFCGVHVTQETVRIILKVIDAEGVRQRSIHRLRRRTYTSDGPNFVIHIDGYDKLKPFGLPIHGAIDGFSRKILWLKVGKSNNDPRYIAHHFINYIKEIKRVPRLVRTDAGTENSIVKCIQVALRIQHTDGMSGYRSYACGRSTANQRIEMLWSFLKRHFTQFWRNVFIGLVQDNRLDNTDHIHLEAIRFCFLPVIQKHLDVFKQTWNAHRIRSQRHSQVNFGSPDLMFYQPLVHASFDRSFPLPCPVAVLDDISRVFTDAMPFRGCSDEFIRLVELLSNKRRSDFAVATNVYEAKVLYLTLVNAINSYA